MPLGGGLAERRVSSGVIRCGFMRDALQGVGDFGSNFGFLFAAECADHADIDVGNGAPQR